MAYEMVMPYHLHMPSYFLETFTEYPDLYLRSFDIPYDDCYYPAFSRCVGIVAMCRF